MKTLFTTLTAASGLALLGTAVQAQDQTRIGLSQPNLEHPYRTAGVADAKEWAAEHPEVELVIVDGRRDSAVQMSSVEDLLVQQVDAILISPNESDALAPVAAEAKAQDVPLIVFDRRLNVPESDYVAYVGADNVEMGRVAGRFIAEELGGEGKVIQLEGSPGASATTDRKAGFEEVMADQKGVEVVSYVGHFRTHEAAAAMEDALVAHADVDAVYAHNDSMALGAAQVLAERGMEDIPIVGMDGGEEGCQGIRDERITATVLYPTMFPEALEVTMAALKGEDVPKTQMLETPLITTENVDEHCS